MSPAARSFRDEAQLVFADLHLDAGRRVVGEVLRREGLGRLRAALVLDEQRAALRAVVRGLRVLEAALRAVNEAQAVSSSGAVFPARIAVSESTSTLSRTPLPPVFCSLATSSARRMSIFPCRMRRWYE